MPGPTHLPELIASLRVPDVRAAMAGLCQAVVPGQTRPRDTVVALTWATSDVGRTIEEVVMPFVPTGRDRMLGAVTSCVRFGPVELIVAQPDQEAGLAAYLSRHGEGVAAIYLVRPGFLPSPGPSGRPAKPLPTPLGRRGWLLPHEWPWGPFVIALESPA